MKKNLKSLGIKSLATLLSVLMIFMMLPMTVFADILEGIQTADAPAFLRQSDIFEVKELRESHVKHFRLEDGSFIAAQYDVPVHYPDIRYLRQYGEHPGGIQCTDPFGIQLQQRKACEYHVQ